jgi:hypothetical protein
MCQERPQERRQLDASPCLPVPQQSSNSACLQDRTAGTRRRVPARRSEYDHSSSDCLGLIMCQAHSAFSNLNYCAAHRLGSLPLVRMGKDFGLSCIDGRMCIGELIALTRLFFLQDDIDLRQFGSGLPAVKRAIQQKSEARMTRLNQLAIFCAAVALTFLANVSGAAPLSHGSGAITRRTRG